MKLEEVVVGIILAGILAIFAWMAGAAFRQSGAPSLEVGLLCAAIILGGVILGGLLRLLPRSFALLGAAGALLALVLLAVVHYKLVAICGDDVCSAGECASCAADCTAAQCADGRCERPENCGNSKDCSCAPGAACAPGRGGSDERGCYEPRCGDGFCDPGESSQTCCADCYCSQGFICQHNTCIFQRPILTMNPYLLTDSISVTTLAGNPLLTDEAGTPRPLAGLRIQSTGFAKQMNVTYTIPGVISNTVPVGFVKAGEEVPAPWFVQPDPRLLTVMDDRRTSVIITVSYLDTQDDKHTSKLSLPITLLGRDRMDKNGHVALYVTRDISTSARTPQGIWDELDRGVNVTSESGDIRFPLETLTAGEGSPRDVAVLLASAYDAAGLAPSLVETAGGELYVRLRTDRGYVMLDPARFGDSFEHATVSKPGASLWELRKLRAERNFTVLSLNSSLIPGADLANSTTLEQSCVCTSVCGTRAVAVHTVTNNGLVPTGVCLTSTLSTDTPQDQRRTCFALNASQSREFRHGWQGTSCDPVSVSLIIEKSG